MAKNIFRVPHYLIELTKEELMTAMLSNNIANDKEYTYFDIQQEKQFWVAWYFRTATSKPANLPETYPDINKTPKKNPKKKV